MKFQFNTGVERHGWRDLFFQWLVNAAGLVLVSKTIKGVELLGSGWEPVTTVLLASGILGLLNLVVKPILVLVTLPITILTLGTFLLVVNGMVLAVTSYFVDGFRVDGFWSAILGAFLLSIFSLILRAALMIGSFSLRVGRQ